MKIIDLLNKIANREEVPKKIKYDDIKLVLWQIGNSRFYYVDDDEINVALEEFADLNDEIEIIEDTPKKIEYLTRYDLNDKDNFSVLIKYAVEDIYGKLDEIIYKLNELSKKFRGIK